MQFDINFPNGFVLDNSNVTASTILDDFEITSSLIFGNNYRFIIYSVSNSNIQAGDNTVLNLPISSTWLAIFWLFISDKVTFEIVKL